MIHIDYTLNPSDKHGIGLFADQAIKKSDLIYTASPILDLNITQEQFDSLEEREQKEILWWGFFDEPSQMWHVDFDVSKFINHADASSATVTQDASHEEAYLVATRDIERGEELTQNYLEFESLEDLKRRGVHKLLVTLKVVTLHLFEKNLWRSTKLRRVDRLQCNSTYCGGRLLELLRAVAYAWVPQPGIMR